MADHSNEWHSPYDSFDALYQDLRKAGYEIVALRRPTMHHAINPAVLIAEKVDDRKLQLSICCLGEGKWEIGCDANPDGFSAFRRFREVVGYKA